MTTPTQTQRQRVAISIQQGRAERGQMVVEHYDPDPAGRFTRLLTDLMAYAVANSINFEGAAIVAAARVEYTEKTGEDGRAALEALRTAGMPR